MGEVAESVPMVDAESTRTVATESKRVLFVVVSVDSVGPQALINATIRVGKPINLTTTFMGHIQLMRQRLF